MVQIFLGLSWHIELQIICGRIVDSYVKFYITIWRGDTKYKSTIIPASANNINFSFLLIEGLVSADEDIRILK